MNRAKSKRRKEVNIEKKDLERFAGSSDEEEDDRNIDDKEHYAEDEDGGDLIASSLIEEKNDELASGDEEEVLEPEVEVESSSAKMANAMARILGTTTQKAGVSSVVLSKTTTPLQRMQMKEKEEANALKNKRKTNRERNLTSLHIPLSVATTNTIETGGQSVAKELEQERVHRRVATRGVVALFNAITQHQKATEIDHPISKQKDNPKLTKHSFLNKIKSAASTASGDQSGATKEKADQDQETKQTAKWDALKDDYLMDSKKNWDQESSDEDEGSSAEEGPKTTEAKGKEQPKKKRRRMGNKR